MMRAMSRTPVPHPRAGALEEARRLLLDPARCPACGAHLAGPRCPVCALDLAGPAGATVWEASQAAAAALARQAEVVATVRRGAATHPAPVPSGGAGVGAPPPGPAAPPLPSPAQPSTARPSPQRPAPAGPPVTSGQPYVPPVRPAPAPARRPWPVQTVLVTLGAALLAVATLVFLVFTWELLTLGARAAVVALGTAAVLGLAALLRRRGLRVSAEAVAALGSALLALDVWALWATGLLGGAPGWAVGGVGLAACGGLLALYGARTGLRAGTVAAAVLVPVAPLPAALSARTAAAALGGLLLEFALTSLRHHPVVRTRVAERRVLATGAVALAVPLGVVPVAALTAADAGGSVAVVALAVVSAAALVAQSAFARPGAARGWAGAGGLVAAATAAAAVPPVADAAVAWSAPAAAAVAVVGALLALRVPPTARIGAGTATAAAAVAAAASALPEVLLLGLAAVLAVLEPGEPASDWAAASGVTTVSVVVLVAAVGLRLAPALRHVAAALASLALLEGVALLAGSLPQAVGAFGLVTLVALVVPLPPPWRSHARALAVLASLAAVLASATGAAGDATDPERAALAVALTLGAGVALVAARWGGPTARGAGAGVAALLGTGAGATALRLAGAGGLDATLLAATALGLAVTALVLTRTVSRPQRAVLLPTAAAVQALTWLGAASVADGAPAGSPSAVPLVTLPLAAAVQCGALATLGRGRVGLAPRRVATALVVPAAATGVLSAHLVTGRPGAATTSLVAVVLACAAALVARTADTAGRGFRTALEVSGAVVAGLALLGAPHAGVATLELSLLAVTAGVVALAPDRRPLRWWALGLAVLASWTGLAARDVGVPEAYAAPLGLVLAGTGVARLRRLRSENPDGPSATSAVSFLTAGVVLVGVPPALAADRLTVGDARLDRTVLLTAGLLLLAAAAWRAAASGAAVHRAAASALAGCVGLLAVLGPVRRAVASLAGGSGGEVWGLAAAVALGLATLAARRAGAPRTSVVTGVWAAVLVAATPALVVAGTALEDAAVADGAPPLAVARLAAVALVGAALALVGVLRDRAVAVAPGLALLALAAFTGAVGAHVLPLDAVLGVSGVLAGAVGAAWLVRDPRARSWPALGAPCVLVLAPALVGLHAAPAPWRWLVVLGGGVAAVLVGASRRLQAPFVVGAAVLAAEVVLQLVAAAASVVSHVGWWPLLFAGGVVLTVVGVTYERRLRDAREATRFVARLR